MAEAGNNRLRTAALWIAAVAALIFIFYAVRWLTRPKLPVRAARSQVRDLIKTISTNGKVEPQGNFEAHAPQPGMVKAIYVTAGEKIPAGKLMLQMDDADARAKLAAAAAALRGAEANLQAVERGGTQRQQLGLESSIATAKLDRDQAARSLAAVRKLEAEGAASPSEVVQAQQQLDVANASLQSLEQQKSQPFAPLDLVHAKSAVVEAQAAYAAAAQVVAQCNVQSPFAGTVYSLPVSRYEYVDAGATLLALADLDKLRIRAYFDEPEIGSLHLNDPVVIVWDGEPGRTWHGHITGLPSTVITYGTRNVGQVLVSIDDSDSGLLPNTNVTVTVTTSQVRGALTVPREALYIEGGRDYVYLVSGDKLHRAEVQVGALNLTHVQILSGIGDNVLVALGTTNGAALAEGAPIRIVK